MVFNNNRRLHFSPAQQAILTTLLYSDIFSFPLTKEELWHFLIAEKKISPELFDNSLKTLGEYISSKNGYYCLNNREASIDHRRKNHSEFEKKMKRARLVAEKLASIPSILLIGISGGLAAGNASKEDDIDLLIIVKKNTLFVSRLLILYTLEKLGVRRFRDQKNTADMICVNLLFDETKLDWFGKFQDVYTAREIAQVVPLFERGDTYSRFMNANKWIERFLPNVVYSKRGENDSERVNFISNMFINSFFETLFRTIQMSWMKRHQTSETINKHVLAFHPNDYRLKTLRRLRLKMRQLGLLTNI